MEKITWLGSLRWLRDEAGAFIASFWMILALYGVGAWLLWVWFKVDAEFSRPLAGGVIPADVTQNFSWAILAFSVIVGMAAVWCNDRQMKVLKWSWTVLGGIAAVILLFHAYGLAAKVMEKQFDAAEAITTVANVKTDSFQGEIDDLLSERTTLRSDAASAIATYQRSIDSITNDGLDNDEEAVKLAEKQAETIADRDARLAEIRTRLAELREDQRDVDTKEEQDKADSSSFNELFTLMARFHTQTWDPAQTPSNTSQYASGIIFFFILFGFGKVLMMTLFTFAFQMQLRAAEVARENRLARARSDAAKQGWDTRKQAEEDERSQLQIADAGFWSLKIIKALNNNMPKRTVKGTMRTFFSNMEPDAVRVRLQRLMDARLELPKGFYQDAKGDVKRADRAIERGLLAEDHKTYLMQDHIDYILMEGEHAPKKKAPKEEPKPKQEVNGTDHSTDLTIPELGQDDEPNRPPA